MPPVFNERSYMSLIDRLSDPECWEKFYNYKTSLSCTKQFTKELRSFIDEKRYIRVCDAIREGAPFPLPKRAVISKLGTSKKRVIYTYPSDENTVLKLLTYLLLRSYDSIFAENLFSFRPSHTAKKAFARLAFVPDMNDMHSYKVDVSNYFNSVSIDLLLPMLKKTLGDDERLYSFLASLLNEKRVRRGDSEIIEQKGIMAGTPLAAFYANLYLSGLDHLFASKNIPYVRYSDDIIVFARTREETEKYADIIREHLAQLRLSVNPEKECFASADDGWVFLGFYYKKGVIDISPASVTKMKNKMRRRLRTFMRWSNRKNVPTEKAAASLIKAYNCKLYEYREDNELTWTHRFFPVINTDRSLKVIDRYAQDCIRTMISGKHTKARFNVRYGKLKELGYRSLVHEYYLAQNG